MGDREGRAGPVGESRRGRRADVYEVQVDDEARAQIRALPSDALKDLAEAVAVLQLAPWNGAPFRRDKPEGPLRTLPFGAVGLITYLILEDQQIADVLSVLWLDAG